MDPRYEQWIDNYIERQKGVVRGMCQHATHEMAKVFPELTPTPGFAEFAYGARSEHWWCQTQDGVVVDPTARQFVGPPVAYHPWKPGDEVRVGRCMNCGDDIYAKPATLNGDRKCICSPECEKAFEAYLNGDAP